jgi:hypothetical protein
LKENKSFEDLAKPTFYYIGGSGGIRTHASSPEATLQKPVFEKQTKLF